MMGFFAQNQKLNITFPISIWDLRKKHRYGLLKSFVSVLFHIVTICWATERLAIATKQNPKDIENPSIIAQSFAGFYWSSRQVDLIRKMVERHLERLQEDQSIFPMFLQLVDWISPSDSQVQHSQFSEKMYDFEAFIKQGVSFPQVIAYSWHEIITHYKPQLLCRQQILDSTLQFYGFHSMVRLYQIR